MKEVMHSVITDPFLIYMVKSWVVIVTGFVVLVAIGFWLNQRWYNRGVKRGEFPEISRKSPLDTFRENQKKIKTIAASAVIAVAIVAPAQAGDPIQYEDYAAYNWFMRAWNSVFGGFTMGDFAQGISTSNQPTPQALANDAAYGVSLVPSPNGPQGPAGGEGKWHSKNP